jgi:RNA polymerase sigma factor (sigma-70 family)
MTGYNDDELLEMFMLDESKHYAFNLIVRSYQEKLYWHVRRMVIDHDDANDIIQNVFIKIWNNLHKFRRESALYTWFYRIASNETLTFLTQKKRRQYISIDTIEYSLSENPGNSVLINGNDIEIKLQKAILQLPDRQRMVFNMKYFDEMKYEEISEILNVTTGALKASYHHAVKKIEAFLTED